MTEHSALSRLETLIKIGDVFQIDDTEGAPYRLMALELRAAIRLNSGDIEAAHADLNAIIADPQATRGSSGRAVALLLSSGGELPVVAQ